MALITRTYDFVDGTVAEADEVDTDFNTIYDEFNGSIDGDNISSTASLTLASLATDTIAEKTSATGVTIDGIILKDDLDTSGIVGKTETQTLTNKRITKRIDTAASAATYTPYIDSHDMIVVASLQVNTTFNAPNGTPTQGQPLLIRIKDNGTARALSWNAIYRAGDIALPTTTIVSKTMYVGFIYNSTDTKWDLVAYDDNH